jgi:hypothetical protein
MSEELVKQEEKFSDLLSFTNSLDDNFVPVKSCKLCNSQYREEAENKAAEGVSHKRIAEYLKLQGEQISYGAVHAHLCNHLGNRNDARNLKEFASQLNKWSALSQSDDVFFNDYIKMLDREVRLLLSRNPELDAAEVRRNLDAVVKIGNLIGYFKEQIRKLQIEKRPVELVFTSLNKIIQVKIAQNTSTPEIKAVLEDILDQLDKEVGDFSISGE